MIKNHLLFPIYESLEQQFRFRNNYKNDLLHSFKVPAFTLPSFFFSRTKKPYGMAAMEVFSIHDTVTPVATISTSFLQVVTTATYDAFGYTSRVIKRTEDLADSSYDNYQLPCGDYYIRLTEATTGKYYYSEVFEAEIVEGITDGVELVANGDFSHGPVDWVTQGTWSFTGNTGTYTGGSTSLPLKQVIAGADDASHFYKVTFTITNYNDGGNPSRYLRAYTGALDLINNVKITGNGSYTWYVDRVEMFLMGEVGGTVTFSIDDISIQRVTGFENYVSLLLVKDCKFPNSIAPDNYYYSNLLLLDAEIYRPEYGEENVQQENGIFQKITSFTRAFKRHVLSPLLLPEPVADALAQMNTFDTVEVFNGHTTDYFVYHQESDLERQVMGFDVKTQWQERDVYALVDISFDENLSIKDRCCDDNAEILACFNNGQSISLQVAQDLDNDTLTITSNSNPTDLDGAMVELSVAKTAIGDYVDCNSATAVTYNPVITMTWLDFRANGMVYTAGDQLDYVYKFMLRFKQVGCGDTMDKNVCAAKPAMSIDDDDQQCVGNIADPHLEVTLEITLTLYPEAKLDYWDGSQWIETITVVNGTNVLPEGTLPDSYSGKLRLRYNTVTSTDYNIALMICE